MTARRPPPWVWLFAAAAVAYAADRITKLWAEAALAGRPPIVLVPRVLDLTYTTNSGGAFGLGQRAWWLFGVASIAVSVAIVVAAPRIRHAPSAIGLGLILGGALGNLTDRVVRSEGLLRGHVVDFIDIHVWPVFNLADSAIVIGALLLALRAIRDEAGR